MWCYCIAKLLLICRLSVIKLIHSICLFCVCVYYWWSPITRGSHLSIKNVLSGFMKLAPGVVFLTQVSIVSPHKTLYTYIGLKRFQYTAKHIRKAKLTYKCMGTYGCGLSFWHRSIYQATAKLETNHLHLDKRHLHVSFHLAPPGTRSADQEWDLSHLRTRLAIGRRHPRFEGPLMRLVWNHLMLYQRAC